MIWTIEGIVVTGIKHFSERMKKYPDVFTEAVGEKLYEGTINVKVDRRICISEHFRSKDPHPDYPNQVLLFEVCRLNSHWGYRIRPYDIYNGSGGHGDDVIEFACNQFLPDVEIGKKTKLEFFRSK